MPSKRKNNAVENPKPAGRTNAELVERHMLKLKHPLKKEIQMVRQIVKKINKNINERIKWNAPSYYFKINETETDFLTFNHYKDKFVLLVFHHPSIIKIRSGLLKGDYKDRRLIYFESMKDIIDNKKELVRIIMELAALVK